MLSHTLLAGLLVTSTFASPFEIPTALRSREGRKHCSAPVLNANEPNEYCYQFCDFKTVTKVGKSNSFLTTCFVLFKTVKLEVDITSVP